ncbi:glycosyltransferase family 2 protein [Vibrio harveyi]
MVQYKLVSVILPLYNAEKYIAEAVKSVLEQSYENLELIVIDDGSTDNSKKIMDSFVDTRIRFISRENKGLISTLNELIGLARGDIIARMDADDICLPNRIKEQLDILETGIDIVGSDAIIIDEDGKEKGLLAYPHSYEDIISHIPFNSPMIHPSVIGKKKVFSQLYDSEYIHAEDYGLWVKSIFSEGYKVENLAKPLIKYRVHSSSISRSNVKNQIMMGTKIRKDGIDKNNVNTHFGRCHGFIYHGLESNMLDIVFGGLNYIFNRPSKYRILIYIRVLLLHFKNRFGFIN